MANARVGSASSNFLTSGGNLTLTLAQTPTAGNLLVIALSVKTNGTAGVTVTVTDSGGHSLTQAAIAKDGNNNLLNAIFYETVPAGINTTITIAPSSSSGCSAVGSEYSSSSALVLDTTTTGFDNFSGSNTWTTGSASTTATDLLIGSCGQYFGYTSSAFTAGSGWTTVTQTSGASTDSPYTYMEDQLNATSGSYVANGGYTPSGGGVTYANTFASFKASGGGGFTAKFRKTLSTAGTGVGKRQAF